MCNILFYCEGVCFSWMFVKRCQWLHLVQCVAQNGNVNNTILVVLVANAFALYPGIVLDINRVYGSRYGCLIIAILFVPLAHTFSCFKIHIKALMNRTVNILCVCIVFSQAYSLAPVPHHEVKATYSVTSQHLKNTINQYTSKHVYRNRSTYHFILITTLKRVHCCKILVSFER